MKITAKKILGLFIVFAIVAACLPICVHADDSYGLWVGSVKVTNEVTSGDGWSYVGDESGGTLTLNNANITDYHNRADAFKTGICSYHQNHFDLKIVLIGDNKISESSYGIYHSCDYSSSSLTFEGDGNLEITSKITGISCHCNLVFNGTGNIKTTGTYNDCWGIWCYNLKINSGHVTAVGDNGVYLSAGGFDLADDSMLDTNLVTNHYIVTYYENNPDTESDNYVKQYVNNGESFTVKDNVFNRENFVFINWNDPSVEGSSYEAGSTASFDGNKSLYANWGITYLLEFVNEDGTVLQSERAIPGSAAEYTGEIPVKEADAQYTYTFSGWDKDIAPVTEDVTYTAVYTAAVNSYTVQFVDEDETVLQSSEYDYGQTPEYNGETPVKEADAQYTYTFSGWDKDIAPVTEDVTYTAVYDAETNKYTVTFVDGETVIQSYEVAYGETVSEPETPEKEGFEFEGWYADEEFETPFDPAAPVTADVTVYANWEEISYSIVSGDNSIFESEKGEDVVITIARSIEGSDPLAHLTGVEIDEQALESETDYTAEESEGGITITIKAEALEKLSEGAHTVTVIFDDGAVEATLTVKAPDIPDNPATGGSSYAAIFSVLAFAGIAGAAVLATKKRIHR